MELLGDVFRGMPLDTTTIRRDRLNIDGKERSNLFPWNGQFSPQLIEALLRAYARAGELILDPFLGSGTVLCEAGRIGHPCFGTEINPAAFKMARLYRFINVASDEREEILEEIEVRLQGVLPDPLPLLARSEGDTDAAGLHDALADLSACIADRWGEILLDALIVLLDPYKDGLTASRVFDVWARLKATIKVLPHSGPEIILANADARDLPLPGDAADIVLTSPPYINVFNYHQQYRASAEALGWDLLEVARSEIGANRKHRSNRFLTVVQYCLDMTDVLAELKRVCKPGARLILVVGRESNVRKTRFYNGEIVAELGVRCAGLTPQVRQERQFKNKFGAMIHEDILHFTNDGGGGSDDPMDIAKAALIKALEYVPDESRGDLNSAMGGAYTVERSPIYVPERAYRRRTPI